MGTDLTARWGARLVLAFAHGTASRVMNIGDLAPICTEFLTVLCGMGQLERVGSNPVGQQRFQVLKTQIVPFFI